MDGDYVVTTKQARGDASGGEKYAVNIGKQLLQAHRQGLRVNIMVVGETGLGKTTFLHNLTHVRGVPILERFTRSTTAGTTTTTTTTTTTDSPNLPIPSDPENLGDGAEEGGGGGEGRGSKEGNGGEIDVEGSMVPGEPEPLPGGEGEVEEEGTPAQKQGELEKGEEEEVEGKEAQPKDERNELAAEMKNADEALEPSSRHVSSQLFSLVSEDGVRTQLRLIDTPGFGEQSEGSEDQHRTAIRTMVKDSCCKYFDQSHGERMGTARSLTMEDDRVHLCFYFIAPHRLKQADLEFMKTLAPLVNLVPIIAKADSMTIEEREEFELQIRRRLVGAGITSYSFDGQNEARSGPFSIVCSKASTRSYPWGELDTENTSHSDLSILRDLVFQSNLLSVIASTHRKYEECYAGPRRQNRSIAHGLQERELEMFRLHISAHALKDQLCEEKQEELQKRLKDTRRELDRIRRDWKPPQQQASDSSHAGRGSEVMNAVSRDDHRFPIERAAYVCLYCWSAHWILSLLGVMFCLAFPEGLLD